MFSTCHFTAENLIELICSLTFLKLQVSLWFVAITSHVVWACHLQILSKNIPFWYLDHFLIILLQPLPILRAVNTYNPLPRCPVTELNKAKVKILVRYISCKNNNNISKWKNHASLYPAVTRFAKPKRVCQKSADHAEIYISNKNYLVSLFF